jgi:hypothetical protein
MKSTDNNETRAINLYTELDDAIINCAHYRSIGDNEMFLWWQERVTDIEENLLELVHKLNYTRK